ncbi:MAG: DNA-protecting protein DprA [Lentisphaerae bacterium]|nr:DNA-protecting protein DprA [Lentisphaerota bacterium]
MRGGVSSRVGFEFASDGLRYTMNIISEDAKAILLLCGRLGGVSEFEPLDQRDYNQVVRWLLGKNLRPMDLLSLEHTCLLARESGLSEQRLNALLKRGVKLAFAVEAWNQSGIWVVCRSDPDYPARYKEHLKEKAPPILFGAGERSLLQSGGLAIVGSRNVEAEGEAFARDVAAWCARGDMPVVSGGARGVDQIAMTSALEAGGIVIGILADTLLRRSVSREAREALSGGRLLLISPYHPEAGFNVGNAMGRNKLIYALAEYGLVVSADYGKGGTWEGAVEELKRKPGRAVFVRLSGSAPLGNHKLVELGAIRFPGIDGHANPLARLRAAAEATVAPAEEGGLPLFDQVASGGRTAAAVRESTPTFVAKPTPISAGKIAVPASIYDAVMPVIAAALDKPSPVADLAKRLTVSKAQLEVWLKQAVGEKKLRKLTRPVRYARRIE